MEATSETQFASNSHSVGLTDQKSQMLACHVRWAHFIKIVPTVLAQTGWLTSSLVQFLPSLTLPSRRLQVQVT